MINVAIFASGAGTNAKKLLQQAKSLDALCIKLIITDQEQAGVIKIAKNFDTKCVIIPKINSTKWGHEALILKYLEIENISWVFLAGYMKILSPNFLSTFYDKELGVNRVINIHPSLLPAYKGLNAFERAFESNESESGITIHYVNDGIDEGEVITQKKFNRLKTDSLEDFINRGRNMEHVIYPKVLFQLNNCFKDKKLFKYSPQHTIEEFNEI